ncbi:MAG: hypothetical protein C4529_03410 [Deltaproteobacteria bacterium]|nr:MAG: hypothetical protein C4529_03410 [Deltaproteobacteria bacterium]
MRLFRTVLGIDPSGGRLAIVAVRRGVGNVTLASPPLLHESKGDKEVPRLEEFEGVLGEFVARNGLVGCDAVLVPPADRVYLARASFPSLKGKDLRDAIGMELERLFPVSPSELCHSFRRLPAPPVGGKVPFIVAAARSDYIERWEETVARAGLTLTAAVPAAWAVGAAVARISGASAGAGNAAAVIRGPGAAVECTLFSSGEPFFCASRPCPAGDAPAEGLALAAAGFADPPASAGEGPVRLFAPAGWYGEDGKGIEAGGIALTLQGGFAAAVARALSGAGAVEAAAAADPLALVAAYGATFGEERMDLFAPDREGATSGAARAALGAAAAAALALGLAWPSAVAWKAKDEVRRLDAQVAALRPSVERFEESLADLDEAQAKISTLREEASGSPETLKILRELTDRLPNGTWLLSMRVEGRKVDIEGLSPSASEIFPAMTRDGRFRSVEFAAPITRQAENVERFKIRGEYVPESSAAGPQPAAGAGR